MGNVILHPAFADIGIRQLTHDRDTLQDELSALTQALTPWMRSMPAERSRIMNAAIADIQDWLGKLDFTEIKDTIGATQLTVQLHDLQTALRALITEIGGCLRDKTGKAANP